MRLDKTNQKVQLHFGLTFDENDPGATDEIDVCRGCFCQLDLHDEEDLILAPYEDDPDNFPHRDYKCAECGKTLHRRWDNDPIYD